MFSCDWSKSKPLDAPALLVTTTLYSTRKTVIREYNSLRVFIMDVNSTSFELILSRVQ